MSCVYSLAVIDGKLVSGSLDGTIKVWGDLGANQCLHTLTGHTNGVRSLAVIDGKLVSGSWDHTIKVWDLKTNRCLHTLTGHTGTVKSLTVIDGKLVSGSYDRTIKVWGDLETSQCLHTLTGHTGEVTSLAFTDGSSFQALATTRSGSGILRRPKMRFLKTLPANFKAMPVQRWIDSPGCPQRKKTKSMGELFRILNPSSSGPRYGEYAFHDQKSLTSTPQQKAQAIQNYLLRKTAKLFEGDVTGPQGRRWRRLCCCQKR